MGSDVDDNIHSYRVNVFGFPNAKGLNDQNLGLLDQRKA
jgi:carboxylesterase type B